MNINTLDNQINSYEFFKCLKEKNVTSKNKVREVFNNAFKEKSSENCVIFLTGSDGRYEKLSSDNSPYELIVIYNSKISNSEKKEIEEVIQKIFNENMGEYFPEIEIKELEKDDIFTYKNKFIPTRAFDSLRIWGNKNLKKEYYHHCFNQLQVCNRPTYVGFYKNFKQASIQILNKAKSGETKHIDLKTGELFYDGSGIRSTKYPCLRSVQYFVADVIFKQTRAGNLSEAMLNDVRKQRTLPNRIQWLAHHKFIKVSQNQLDAINNAYAKSLYWYEMSQISFEKEKKNYFVCQAELAEVIDHIQAFVKQSS